MSRQEGEGRRIYACGWHLCWYKIDRSLIIYAQSTTNSVMWRCKRCKKEEVDTDFRFKWSKRACLIVIHRGQLVLLQATHTASNTCQCHLSCIAPHLLHILKKKEKTCSWHNKNNEEVGILKRGDSSSSTSASSHRCLRLSGCYQKDYSTVLGAFWKDMSVLFVFSSKRQMQSWPALVAACSVLTEAATKATLYNKASCEHARWALS